MEGCCGKALEQGRRLVCFARLGDADSALLRGYREVLQIDQMTPMQYLAKLKSEPGLLPPNRAPGRKSIFLQCSTLFELGAGSTGATRLRLHSDSNQLARPHPLVAGYFEVRVRRNWRLKDESCRMMSSPTRVHHERICPVTRLHKVDRRSYSQRRSTRRNNIFVSSTCTKVSGGRSAVLVGPRCPRHRRVSWQPATALIGERDHPRVASTNRPMLEV